MNTTASPDRPLHHGAVSAVVLCLAVVTAVLLSGCGDSPTPVSARGGSDIDATAAASGCVTGSSLTLVVPVHQGAQAPALPQQWQCTIEGAINGGVPISIVTAEGTPQVVLRGFTAKPSSVNDVVHRNDLVAAQNTLIQAAAQAHATSNGDDLLGALSLAADLNSTYGPNGVILSLDSGLTDSGVIRIADPGMTAAPASDVAAFVAANNACPAITGQTVHLYALGYGVAPQPALSQRQRDVIAEIFTAIVRACGSPAAQVIAVPRTGAGPKTSFTTRQVAPDVAPTMTVAPATTVRVDDNTALGFKADSDQLRDPGGAGALLAPVAEQLKSNPKIHVTITGSTSNGATAWPSLQALGAARAASVARILSTLGVPGDRMTTVGVGYLAQPPVTDLATAALNRAVTLSFS